MIYPTPLFEFQGVYYYISFTTLQVESTPGLLEHYEALLPATELHDIYQGHMPGSDTSSSSCISGSMGAAINPRDARSILPRLISRALCRLLVLRLLPSGTSATAQVSHSMALVHFRDLVPFGCIHAYICEPICLTGACLDLSYPDTICRFEHAASCVEYGNMEDS